MQTVASAIMINPALALVTGLVAGVLLALIVQRLIVRGINAAKAKTDNPLEGMFQSEVFDEHVEAIEERRHFVHHRGAVMRARVDHLPQVGHLWGPETRDSAVAQVAQVMRAGVRKGDTVQAAAVDADTSISQETIEIHTPDVSEKEAGAIARRLLDTLSHMPVPGMSSNMRLSASIGVASRLPGESEEDLRARAEEALTAAQAAGEDHVVTATQWEEIKLLPAPEPTQSKSSHAA